jgi:hypothetical protein
VSVTYRIKNVLEMELLSSSLLAHEALRTGLGRPSDIDDGTR